MLIRTIPDSDWSTIDDRALTHPGDIVDLGCAPWNWSRFFIGKKRVIGADPHAEPINGAELFQGVIGAKNTMAKISTDGDSSTVMPCVSRWDHLVKMITWKQFKYDFRISDIAALKVNIEGLE